MCQQTSGKTTVSYAQVYSLRKGKKLGSRESRFCKWNWHTQMLTSTKGGSRKALTNSSTQGDLGHITSTRRKHEDETQAHQTGARLAWGMSPKVTKTDQNTTKRGLQNIVAPNSWWYVHAWPNCLWVYWSRYGTKPRKSVKCTLWDSPGTQIPIQTCK